MNIRLHKNGKSKRGGGFSLIETVIYVTLLAILLVTIVNMFILMAKSWTSVKLDKSLLYSSTTAFERMTREIKDADSVNVAGSVFATSSPTSLTSKLALNVYTSGGATTSMAFFIPAGSQTLDIQEATGTSQLVLSNTNVTNLLFWHIVTPQSEAVRIQLQLQASYMGSTKTENFYTTAVVRGSYQN